MSWGWLRSRIDLDGDPYMDRWEIRTPWFGIRLHHILRSDYDRALHDHPWSFVSLILWGSYREVRYSVTPQGAFDPTRCPVETVWRRPMSLAFRRAEDAHRLVLDRPALTLVLTAPKRRDWGYWTRVGWVHWRLWAASPEDYLHAGVVYAGERLHRRVVAVIGDVVVYSNGGDHVYNSKAERFRRWLRDSHARPVRIQEPVHRERAA